MVCIPCVPITDSEFISSANNADFKVACYLSEPELLNGNAAFKKYHVSIANGAVKVIERVLTGTTNEDVSVVAHPTIQFIVAVSAVERVVARQPAQAVVAQAATHGVVAAGAAYDIVTRCASKQLRAIDKGLANSRIALVLVTPALLTRLPKEGIADKELSALLARDQLIPIVHNTTYEKLRDISPLLGSRSGLDTVDNSMASIAAKIAELVAVEV